MIDDAARRLLVTVYSPRVRATSGQGPAPAQANRAGYLAEWALQG